MQIENFKPIAIFSTICFALGLIFGRHLTKDVQNTQNVVKTEIKAKSEQIVKTATKTDTKIVYRTFYKTGQIKSQADKVTQVVKVDDTAKKVISDFKEDQKVITISKNWQIGIFYEPTTATFDITKITPQLSYRVISNFWISAQSDVMLTQPKIGIQYQF